MSQKRDPYIRQAVVVRVVDGDTIDLDVDLGFRVFHRVRARLLGIDAPELRGDEREYGKAAKSWLEKEILGRDVTIETVKKGKYGRWLATVFLGQENMNLKMVAAGHARESA